MTAARTVWLASYPKSGNTWFRIFLANLLYPEQAPVDINALPLRTPIASARFEFDQGLGLPSSLLLPDEVRALRPLADEALAASWPEPVLYRKAHDAYEYLPDGRPMMGAGPGFAALYFLRHPCDVAVSAANHWSCTPDEAAARMLDSEMTLASGKRGVAVQLAQRQLTWEGHVLSWLAAPLSLRVLRYEDMRRQPLPTFRRAVRFLGLSQDDTAIQQALDACTLERLQAQEHAQGFRETPKKAQRFFRRGVIGEGEQMLSAEHREALQAAWQRVAASLGSEDAGVGHA